LARSRAKYTTQLAVAGDGDAGATVVTLGVGGALGRAAGAVHDTTANTTSAHAATIFTSLLDAECEQRRRIVPPRTRAERLALMSRLALVGGGTRGDACSKDPGRRPVPVTKETICETFHLDDEGVDRVIEQVKALIHEGNVRRLIVKDRDGVTLIEAPLTFGVVGAMLLPIWAAIVAIAAIVADATVVVERRESQTPA
jgi:hypothetical protein